jgi:hypothetical protein
MNLKEQPPRSGAEPQPDAEAVLHETSYDQQLARRFDTPLHMTYAMHDVADCVESMMLNHAKNRVVKADRDDTR